ncbi:hypothetical protein CRI94_04195 [Longibacter salinarum]|uniref:Lipoprotein n=1 Tax=Longibacter salinarum TaxID=1850348 RepID=A0A2A8D0A7_9BACT|nr:hypothetical protein [Longibacter salinarum]PEN14247.1 hypothetical protein CRI94_04195 [Longibacter salinarum]
MTIRPLALVCALCLTGLFVACSGAETTTDESGRPMPSESAAEDAITESLIAFNDACINPQALSQGETFPVTLIEPDTTRPTVAVRQFLTLEDAELLSSNRIVDERGLVKNTFTLTDDGQKSLKTVYQFRGWRSAFCYATPEVTEIDTIFALRQRAQQPLAEVQYSYELTDVEDWARRDDIQRNYRDVPDILRETNQTKSGRETVALTDTGWRSLRVIRRTDESNEPTPGQDVTEKNADGTSNMREWQ